MNEYLDKDTQIEMLKLENQELKNRLNTYILPQKIHSGYLVKFRI